MTTASALTNLKILLIGASSVGKSSLLLQFSDSLFLPSEETSATIGVDYKTKQVARDGKNYKLSIWGVFLVYSIDDRSTFDSLHTWFDELETYASEDVVRIIVANKIDKQHLRVVTTEEGQAVARQKNCLYFEASAKQPEKVTEMFDLLIDEIIATPSLINPPKAAQNLPGSLNLSHSTASDENNYCSC